MAVKVDTEKCEGAGECVQVCPTNALSVTEGKAKVDDDACADCGGCVDACPHQALSMP